jgi:hypothetical protein
MPAEKPTGDMQVTERRSFMEKPQKGIVGRLINRCRFFLQIVKIIALIRVWA